MIIPGVYTQFENPNVAALQADPWPQVLALLGQSGESVMIDLLMDCSVFIKIETGFSNYYQLNGMYNVYFPMTLLNVPLTTRKAYLCRN